MKGYRYFLLKNCWLARLKEGEYSLADKEFYKNGEWVPDDELNLRLNDCIMDYGDGSVFDYEEISEEEAQKQMELEDNRVEQLVRGILGPPDENPTAAATAQRARLADRALEYLMFADEE